MNQEEFKDLSELFGNNVTIVEPEDTPDGTSVLCDFCNKDWSASNQTGGFLFGSHAICPDCADEQIVSIYKHKEEHYIKSFCKEYQSFANFVRDIRRESQ